MDSVNQLKSGTISADNIDDLISKIEAYVTSGDLEPGIANSFLSKLSNAKKSLEKGVENAAANQLCALQNQLEDLIFEGTIDTSIGEELILDIREIKGELVVDERDGKVYHTVKIGEQFWMAENLAYDVGAGCWAYNNEESNVANYGRLYTWEAAKSACPSGWHLPTDEEWKQLEMAIGMSQSEVDDTGWRGTNEGAKLKATSGWYGSGNGSDDYGFSGLPGGCRFSSGYFSDIGYLGAWWSSTEYSNNQAWYRSLNHFNTKFARHYYFTDTGFSVRCVRD